MNEQTETVIRDGLSQCRETLNELRYVCKGTIDGLDRTDKLVKILDDRSSVVASDLIRIKTSVSNLEDAQKAMATDVRSVRNSIIGSLIVAVLIAVSGLAFSGVRHSMQNPLTVEKSR